MWFENLMGFTENDPTTVRNNRMQIKVNEVFNT